MGLLFTTTTEQAVERKPNTVSSPAPPPPPLRTCWSCLGGPEVTDLDHGARVCASCGRVVDDTAFTDEWPPRGQLLIATTEHGPVEPNAHTDTLPPLSDRPPHPPSPPPPVAGPTTTECSSCLDGPVVTDPDSGALVCASCGLVHDAGDAEFVHRIDFTDAGRTGSVVYHGW